jgi:hypothetical protein
MCTLLINWKIATFYEKYIVNFSKEKKGIAYHCCNTIVGLHYCDEILQKNYLSVKIFKKSHLRSFSFSRTNLNQNSTVFIGVTKPKHFDSAPAPTPFSPIIIKLYRYGSATLEFITFSQIQNQFMKERGYINISRLEAMLIGNICSIMFIFCNYSEL